MVSVVASADATQTEPNPIVDSAFRDALPHSDPGQHGHRPQGDFATLTKQSQALLGLLGQRYVQYYPALAQLTGSIKAALMLGHALYWTRHYLREHSERNGWFWKTGQEWTDATGLSVDEQQSARRILTDAGLLEERTSGFPRRLHFRVNLHALGHQLAERAAIQFTDWHWGNALTRTLLGRPIAFFKPLADLSNGINAALYLSHLLQAQRAALMRKKVSSQGYFHCDKNDMASLLVMGTKAVRNARAKLRSCKLIDETLTGQYQVKIMVRLNIGDIFGRLQHLIRRSPTNAQVFDLKGMAESAMPVSGKGHPSPESLRQYREMGKASLDRRTQAIEFKGMADSVIPASGKGQEVPFSPHQCREKGQTIIGFTTLQKEKQQPQQTATTQAMKQAPSCCRAPLIFPSQLTELELRAAAAMARKVPVDQLQLVFDEWAGQLTNPSKQIRNKLGYLRPIVSAAEQGSFFPTVGLAVAEARMRRMQLDAKVFAAQQKHDAAILADSNKPSNGNAREVAVAEMRKILSTARIKVD